MINLVWVLLALVLVLFNALFVAAEFGMVKLRATRLEDIRKNHGIQGRILFTIHQHLDAYLSACQLGITFASLGLGWVGEPAFTHLLEPVFTLIGIASPELVSILSFLIAFFLLSFLHIVVGELMPKSVAIRQSENVSLWTALPLYGFYWLMYPLIWLLNGCSNLLLRVLKLDAVPHGEHSWSSDEIKLLLSTSHVHGDLSREELDIIEHTLDLANLKVTEVMRSGEEMIMLDISQPISRILEQIMTHRYSRYPVYDPDQHDVIGMIHVKDILLALYQQGEITELNSLLRPVLKLSRHVPAVDVLRKFREGMPHFALVYGHGSIIGFITLDNLLQILVGRIKDEFHRTRVDWTRLADGSLSASGTCSIYSLEQALDKTIEAEDDIDTLNGLIFHKLNSVPKEGERIEFPEFDAVIEKASPLKVITARIYPK